MTGQFDGRTAGFLQSDRVFAACLVGLLLIFAAHSYFYRFVCDDAYIAFRFSKNLLLGRGLVFNPGELVEGYTGFLWVLQLAGLAGLGLSLVDASLLLSSMYSVLTLAMIWRLTSWFKPESQHFRHPETARRLLFLGILAFLVTHRNFAAWTTSGLENRSFTFFVLAALVLGAESRESQSSVKWASLAIAGACLTRPDGMLVFGCLGLWWLAWGLVERRLLLGRLIQWSVPALLIVAAHLLFRQLYYGQWVPNTYFAKVVRPWPEMGLIYVGFAFLQHGLWLTLPLGLFSMGVLSRTNLARLGLLLLTIGAHLGYLVRIGGDRFELRPMDFYWPVFSLLLVLGLVGIGSRLRQRFGFRASRAGLVCAGLFVFALGVSVFLPTIAALENVGKTRWQDIAPGMRPLDRMAWTERLPLLGGWVRLWGRLASQANSRLCGTPIEMLRAVAQEQIRGWQDAEGLERWLPPSTRVIEGRMGVVGYWLDLPILDYLGLTNAVVARYPLEQFLAPNPERFLAHDRVPPPGYIEEWDVKMRLEPLDQTDGPLAPGQFRVRLDDGRTLKFYSARPEWVWQSFDPETVEPWFAPSP